MFNAFFTGKVYLEFDNLPSTNDYCMEMIAKSRPIEGTAVRAVSQSAGRGQFGSRWQAEPGKNLTVSIIYCPQWLSLAQQYTLSIAVALGLRDAVVHLLHPYTDASSIKIKWPNDLYLYDRKVAGILIQNTVQGAQIQYSIVGIGLNVNQTVFDPELPHAGALIQYAHEPIDLQLALETLFFGIEQRYLQLKSGKSLTQKTEYESHLYGKGQQRRFLEVATQTSFEGEIEGITNAGQLIIRDANQTRYFDVKSVQFI